MSFILFKNTFKKNWGLLLIFASVLCAYLAIIISLINPKDMAQVKELFGTMGGFMNAFGINIEAMTDPLAYTASTFFGIIVLAFTMVFYVIQNTRLIAKPVDNTSMAYILSMPISRTTIVLTQGVYLICAMLIHSILMFVVGVSYLSTMKDYIASNYITSYLNLIGVTFMLTTMIAMLSYFFSVAFCGSKLAVGLSAGVPIGLLIMSMLGGAGGEQLKWLKSITPFGWLDSVGIVTGKVETLWLYIIFGGAITTLLLASVLVFNKKRLTI